MVDVADSTTLCHWPSLTTADGVIEVWFVPNQVWLVCLGVLQVHSQIVVPVAVPRFFASRHWPLCTPMILPSAVSDHFWLSASVQS